MESPSSAFAYSSTSLLQPASIPHQCAPHSKEWHIMSKPGSPCTHRLKSAAANVKASQKSDTYKYAHQPVDVSQPLCRACESERLERPEVRDSRMALSLRNEVKFQDFGKDFRVVKHCHARTHTSA
eukprot:5011142-Amphidinium_carterae.1